MTFYSALPGRFYGIGVSLLAIITATLARMMFDSLLGDSLPYVFYFIGTFMAGWMAGWSPAMPAVVAGFFVSGWFFVEPRHSFSLVDSSHTWNNLFCLAAGLGFAAIGGALRRMRVSIDVVRREAAAKAHQLEAEKAQHRQTEAMREMLAALVESSQDAIFAKTLTGAIATWNHGAEKVFGYTAEEIVGKNISQFVPSERLREEIALFDRVRRGETVERYETIYFRKDGTKLDASISLSPILDGAGKLVGVSSIIRDITERKRLISALEHAQSELKQQSDELEVRVVKRTAELKESLESLNIFTFAMAHDLRAPLRRIGGFTSIVFKDNAASFDPESKMFTEKILTEVSRMDTLLNGILLCARLHHENVTLQPIPLQDVLSNVHEHFEEELQTRRARLEYDVKHIHVEGHPLLLEHALANLVSNALKFVAPETLPHVRIHVEIIETRIRIIVQDNGIGVDAKQKDHIFQIFQRADSLKSFPGSGIGLALVRKAAERMNGRVGLDSEPGKGSSFWIELPGARKNLDTAATLQF